MIEGVKPERTDFKTAYKRLQNEQIYAGPLTVL